MNARISHITDLFSSFSQPSTGEFIPFPIVGGVTKAQGGVDIQGATSLVGGGMDTDVSGLAEISERFISLSSAFNGARVYTGKGV